MSVAPGYDQQPGMMQPGMMQPGGMQQQTVVVGAAPQTMIIMQESKPDSGLGMAIFTCLCCFCPLGLPAIIFACMVDSRWDSGDKEGAKAAARTATILWKVALGLGIAGIIIALIIVPVYLFIIVPAQIAAALSSG
ncbi:PREDICTED: transmembrane protein 91-like isoform X2 [Branchiostoma belcheri]|uniref:Transmembrane protein 91-like isoform X2 n=1 Tax=Branchiostoma belcheri TaxID=7741 RepID=A0A6P4ZNK6_BRABE|nr:PREDICTED: transmembrane protein 91-like isoform X2 [Branchiostoma belcheri]